MIKREQFIWGFLKKDKIPNCFNNVSYKDTIFVNTDSEKEEAPELINIGLFPTFLTFSLKNIKLYHTKKINNKNLLGAGISISDNLTVDSYLKDYISNATKKNIRRFKNRLEATFKISYEYNFGQISEEKCVYLLSTLKRMLTKRFQEKNIQSVFLKNWENYTENAYSLINQKKLSLFVIYDNKRPISISVNYHINNSILFSECNCYDIDYGKFGLGHMDNYILLKWCIDNKYKFLDLGNGLSFFKKKWCNHIYEFQYLIFYKKNSTSSKILAFKEITKIKIKNFLKKIKIDYYYNNLKYSLSKKKNKPVNSSLSYETELVKDFTEYDDKLQELNIHLDENNFLKKPIYDALYSYQERIDDVKVFKVLDNKYLMRGKKTHIIIYIN